MNCEIVLSVSEDNGTLEDNHRAETRKMCEHWQQTFPIPRSLFFLVLHSGNGTSRTPSVLTYRISI